MLIGSRVVCCVYVNFCDSKKKQLYIPILIYQLLYDVIMITCLVEDTEVQRVTNDGVVNRTRNSKITLLGGDGAILLNF
jgi:hypothetical protein